MGLAAFSLNLKRFAIAFRVFEFACNAKSFVIAWFFFLSEKSEILLVSVFGRTSKHFLPMFHRCMLLRILVTSTGLISLAKPKKVCVRTVSLVVICDACGP